LKLAIFDIKDWPSLDQEILELIDADTLVVVNKCDLGPPKPPLVLKGNSIFLVSVLTGTGIDILVDAIIERVAGIMEVGSSPALTRIRHRNSLEDCSASLSRCLKAPGLSSELVAEDLRMAVRCLGRITGRVDVDDVLDFIFKNFCIGK
jgi:tRNA modification GTPase